MYYVPDGAERAGYYECDGCGERFLDIRIAPSLVCPYCGEVPDMEIGPDDEMPKMQPENIASSCSITIFNSRYGSLLLYWLL